MSCANTHPVRLTQWLARQTRRLGSAAARAEAEPRPFRALPGPLGLPYPGRAHWLLPSLGSYHNEWCAVATEHLRERYGPLVRVELPARRAALFVFLPEHMQQVFESGCVERVRFRGSPLEEQRRRAGLASVVPGEGVYTHGVWSTVETRLKEYDYLKNLVAALDRIADDVVLRLETVPDEASEEERSETWVRELHGWAVESLWCAALGERGERGGAGARLADLTGAVLSRRHLQRSPRTLRSQSPDFQQAVRDLDQHLSTCEELVERSLRTSTLSDEVGLRRELRALPPPLRRALAADLLLAGTDMVSCSAAGLLYELARHPAPQQRLADELAAVEASEPGEAGEEELHAAVCEALRLRSPAPAMLRRTVAPLLLAGYRIPPGVDVMLCQGAARTCPHQFPRAAAFVPERWRCPRAHPLHAAHAHELACAPPAAACPGAALAARLTARLATRLLARRRLEWHGPPAPPAPSPLRPPYRFVLVDP